MEKLPRLKEESEKLVSSIEDSASTAMQIVGEAPGAQPADSQQVDSQKVDSKNGDARVSVVAPVQVIRDAASEREAKKLADQEFLIAYKKHELHLRIRFGVVALLILGVFAVSVPKFFAYIDTEKRLVAHVVPAVSTALLGEKDAAYYHTSQLPIPESQNTVSDLLKNRKKILDKAIAELEGGGRTAVFSRLGAEQYLFKANQREIGLKYGDYLIGKYPNLPSNYLFRAEVDLGNGDISNAISEYDQFFALLKNASLAEKETWQDSIENAVWACIDYGRVDKAKEYFRIYKDLGVDDWNHRYAISALPRSIMIAEFDQLDVDDLKKTSFWTPALEKYASKLIKQIKSDENSFYSPPSSAGAEHVGTYTRAGDFESAQSVMSLTKKFRFMSPRLKAAYAAGTADLALSMNRPNDAVAAINEYKQEYGLSSEMDYLLARAYARMHENQKAIEAADAGLANTEDVQSPGVYSLIHPTNYRLGLLAIKARILIDSGKLQPALEICNQGIKDSPDWIAPKLLKLEIMRKQNNQLEASRLTKMISSQLEKVAP